MENNTKRNSPLVYFILMFIAAVFFELYWINIHPYDYFMLIGIGLVVLITGYLSFDGIIKMKNESDELRREQNETMIKAQKAIYLATKKNAAEAENMQVQSLKAVNVLMDRMVESITDKQLEAKSSNEANDISSLINELSASNAKLAKEVQNAITVNQLVKANEDLIKNVKDVLGTQADEERQLEIEELPQTDAVELPQLEIDELPQTDAVELPQLSSEMYDFAESDSEADTDEDDALTEAAMNNDIAGAEAAVADASQTIEAIEAASDLETAMSSENGNLSPEEIAKLFADL